MEIEIDCGLRVKINQNDNVSSVIKSPNASGTVIVSRLQNMKIKNIKLFLLKKMRFITAISIF